MADSWTEMWSVGSGRARTYCGIAEAEGEFAVDLFSGDTCLSSEVLTSRGDAVHTAQALRQRYATPLLQSPRAVGLSASASLGTP